MADFTATSARNAVGLVMVQIGPFNLAFAFEQVVKLDQYTQVYEEPEELDGFYCGKIRYRRDLLPLISLEQSLGLPPARAASGNALIIKLIEDCLAAVRVDGVVELNTRQREFLPLPRGMMEAGFNLFSGWVETGESAGYLVDPEHLLTEQQLDEISSILF